MAHSAESFLYVAGISAAAQDLLGALDAHRARATARSCVTPVPGNLATTGDVRIKACLKPTEQDLFTIYHELGTSITS